MARRAWGGTGTPQGAGEDTGWEDRPGKEPGGREGAATRTGSPAPRESPLLECTPEVAFINVLFSL